MPEYLASKSKHKIFYQQKEVVHLKLLTDMMIIHMVELSKKKCSEMFLLNFYYLDWINEKTGQYNYRI